MLQGNASLLLVPRRMLIWLPATSVCEQTGCAKIDAAMNLTEDTFGKSSVAFLSLFLSYFSLLVLVSLIFLEICFNLLFAVQVKILLPRTFRESQKNAHGNSSFGWVEPNIMLDFLISEIFGFLVRTALYFRTEGVIYKALLLLVATFEFQDY